MEKSNKKRGANYTYIEKQMFLKLVDEYKHIVENKVTTSECVQAKQNAWETIAKKYNDISTTGPRSWKQLRHLYENLKQRIRKNDNEKNEIMKNQNILDAGEHRHMIEIKPLITAPYDDAATFFENTCSNDEDTMDEEKLEIQPEIDLDILDNDQGHSSRSGSPKPKGIVQKYYSMKIKNAALERKYLMQRKKCLEIQHKYKVMIAKLKLQLIRKKLQQSSSDSNSTIHNDCT
ncbi:myb/SANT-like DNA-binding domain-containing protein 3 [Aricia agestis]|uniref:myb/SANT-like DNA-binding domain-containing protein 3 n=1 Tax=Aricia agestis TaxID=91739 RepID=UPI001C209323|nr:myb/SANT-like DNA-binding domain-containing protein 3 [Aricia agestis]